jgi:predicted MFS family arabinose efflux permease
MTSASNPIDRWSVYTAAGFLAFCGMLIYSIMPLVVHALHLRYGFREAQSGDILGFYFGGVTAVSLTTFAWIRRINWRTIAAVGQAIAVVTLFATMAANNFLQLSILMGISGVGSGMTYALMLTLLGDSDDADRAFAINLIFQAVPAVLMLLLLPLIFVNDATDMRRLSFVMGTTMLVLSAGVWWLPRSGRKGTVKPNAAHQPAERTALGLPLLGIFITFLFMMSCTAPWTFIEEAAGERGIDGVFVGLALAGSMFAAVIGSVAAAIIGDRFGKLRPVCIGAVVYVVGILLLHVFHTRGIFALGAFLFYLPSNFLLAYSLGLTAEVDTGGRLIGVSTASMLGAPLIGPPIAGRLYEAYGFASNLMMGLVSVLLGAVVYAILLQMGRRTAMRGSANAEGVVAAVIESTRL